MKIKLVAALVGLSLSLLYAYMACFTTLLKGSGLDIFFISSGIVIAPVGAAILWLLESTGAVPELGMAGGFVMFALGAWVLWFVIFSVAAFFIIRKLNSGKNH
jgi:hypothetical protein